MGSSPRSSSFGGTILPNMRYFSISRTYYQLVADWGYPFGVSEEKSTPDRQGKAKVKQMAPRANPTKELPLQKWLQICNPPDESEESRF